MSSVFLLYLFPRGGQFKYEFQKGRIWQYPDYYAPFDFSILKSKAEFEADQQKALQDLSPYLRSDQTIKNAVFEKFPTSFDTYFSEVLNTPKYDSLYQFGTALLEEIYQYGVLPPNYISNENTSINLIQGTLEIPLSLEAVFRSDTLFEFLSEQISTTSFSDYEESYKDLFFVLITPNLFPDTVFDENAQREVLRNISQSRGIVSSGSLIIKKGDILNNED